MNYSRGLKPLCQLAKFQHHLMWWMCMKSARRTQAAPRPSPPLRASLGHRDSPSAPWLRRSGLRVGGRYWTDILDARLKEKIRKPWKGVLCIHFRVSVTVCVHAGYSATDHSFLAMKTNFWVDWSVCFSKIPFYAFDFWWVKLCFPATGHSFSSRNVKFWLKKPCTNKN